MQAIAHKSYEPRSSILREAPGTLTTEDPSTQPTNELLREARKRNGEPCSGNGWDL